MTEPSEGPANETERTWYLLVVFTMSGRRSNSLLRRWPSWYSMTGFKRPIASLQADRNRALASATHN
jgi:hypothetical protein